MLTLHGQVMNVVEVKARKSRTGDDLPAYHQVQMLCEEPVETGGVRMQLHTFTTDQPDQYRSRIGSELSVPVGVYVKDGGLRFFLRRTADAKG